MVVLVLGLAWGTSVAQGSVRAVLHFAADGASCGGSQAMVEAVRARLGYDPFVAQSALQVRVQVVEATGRLSGTIRLSRAGETLGERALDGRVGACSNLMDSLALAISLALDPDALDRPRRPRRTQEPPARRVAVTRLAHASVWASRAPIAPVSPWADALEGRLGLLLEEGPAPSAGLAFGWSRGRPHWSMGAEVRGRLPSQSVEAGLQITTSALALSGRLCLEGEGTRACGLATAGGQYARGDGLSEPGGAWHPSATVAVQIAARILAIEGGSMDLVSELGAPVIRHALRSGDALIWTTPSASLYFGLALRWPRS